MSTLQASADLQIDVSPGVGGALPPTKAAPGPLPRDPGAPAESGVTVLLGGAGDDVLTGNDLANWLQGNGGNDTLRGEGGVDTAGYFGAWAEYSLTRSGSSYVLAHANGGADGTDTLHGVERLAFADVRVALDVEGHAGMAWRLYQAAFQRAPDVPGLGHHIQTLDNGHGIVTVAMQFLESAEFHQLYGGLSNAQFIARLYVNALGREADAAGQDYHVGTLEAGTHTRADVLVAFSESPENQAKVAGSIEGGMLFAI